MAHRHARSSGPAQAANATAAGTTSTMMTSSSAMAGNNVAALRSKPSAFAQSTCPTNRTRLAPGRQRTECVRRPAGRDSRGRARRCRAWACRTWRGVPRGRQSSLVRRLRTCAGARCRDCMCDQWRSHWFAVG